MLVWINLNFLQHLVFNWLWGLVGLEFFFFLSVSSLFWFSSYLCDYTLSQSSLWAILPFNPQPSVIFYFILFFKIYLFIYFWLRWVFVAASRLSLVAVSRGYSSLRCAGFPLWWLLFLRSTGSRRPRASVVVACGLSSCGSWALEHRVSSCGAQA